jgi:hypothetical protein
MACSLLGTSFETWGREMLGAAFDSLDQDQLANLHANYAGRNDATAADIQAVAGIATPGLIEAAAQTDEERRIARLEREVLRKERLGQLEAKIPMAHTVSASRRNVMNGDVITTALCLAGGIGKPESQFPERVLNAADKVRGIGLQSLLMEAACSAGYHAHAGEYINAGNLRRVLTAAFAPQIQAAGGFSTLEISNVLANTANKMLMDGFSEMPSEWRSISAIKNVNNFKEHTFVRLLDSLEFDELGPAAEIKHGTLGDTTMTGRARTYAKMLTITREDIINDDLGALTDVPRRLGRAADSPGHTWAFARMRVGMLFRATLSNPRQLALEVCERCSDLRTL